ncbi:hypothetical protein PPACK8108_LOCUS8981 [Phakopsora pachyrhizi]|uniref:Uncharacterized protein n=1 Tax=Phakopsora pachyrhizi TaxID=170000 RepID=A0AAV0AVP6_PHAPC|nr:hypothetical protein PPACK8108_LOCUS8981 [Phakopsora pachyrhizi]
MGCPFWSRTQTAISSSSSLQNSSSPSRHYQRAEQTGFVFDQPSTVITPSFQVEPSSGQNHLSLPLDISTTPDVPSSSSKGGNEDMSPVQLIEGTKQNKQSIPKVTNRHKIFIDIKTLTIEQIKECLKNYSYLFSKNERYSQVVALYCILAKKINKQSQKPSCFEGSRGPQLVRQLSTQLRLKQPQENIEVQPLIIANDHLSENSRGSVCSSNNQFLPPDLNHQKNLPGNHSTSKVSSWRTQVLSSANEDTALQETLYLKETFQELVNQNKDVIDRLDSLVKGVKSLSIRAQELPSKPGSQPTGNPSNIPQGGPLYVVFSSCVIFKVYLLTCLDNGRLPPAATSWEKAGWCRKVDLDIETERAVEVVLDNASDLASEGNSDEVMHGMSDSEFESDRDPSFPYGNGPGHCQASAQTLAIIWQTMRKAGVAKFRPDLNKGFSTGDNQFLWNIALQTFINLVCLGEYKGISLDIYHEEDIWIALQNHIWLRLMRQYQEESLGLESQDAKSKAQRGQSRMTKDVALDMLPQLCLAQVNTQPTKYCTVLRMPWRSTLLGKLMVHINILQDPRNSTAPQRSNARPASEHISVSQAKESNITRKCNLPVGCYSSEWLRSQPVCKKLRNRLGC